MVNNRENPDIILLVTTCLIVLLGFIIFTSVSMARMAEITESFEELNLGYFLFRQFVLGVLPGLLIGFLLYKAKLEHIKKWAPVALVINLIVVTMVFIPGLGQTIRGATRWLSIGGISFQPSEFLKLTFIIYLASWLSNRTVKDDNRLFSETLLAFGAVCVLISGLILLQRDLSTLIVIMASGFMMYFTYRTPLSHILLLIIGGVAGLASFIALFPYRLERVKDLLGSITDPEGVSYQAQQALLAIGSGGLFGLGFGVGHQKYGFLPFAMSDSIFAAYAEEAGFIGSLLLILLFLIFAWRGVKIAKRNKDSFFSLMAVGISFWIFFQAFVHIGSMVGILPVTGIPLPFVSHGRAHFIAELAAVGILLNISKS